MRLDLRMAEVWSHDAEITIATVIDEDERSTRKRCPSAMAHYPGLALKCLWQRQHNRTVEEHRYSVPWPVFAVVGVSVKTCDCRRERD